MAPVYRDDPYAVYNFELLVTGVSPDGKAVKGSFMEVSGFGVEMPAIEYRNGSENITMRKIPGLIKYTNIVLKWGVTGDLIFWNWVVAGMNGLVQRAPGSIVLLNENRAEVQRWNFTNGWPCKWTGTSLNAKNNEIAMDTLEICHEGLQIDGQG